MAPTSTRPLVDRVGPERLNRASELLRAAAHPQRLAILDALGNGGRMCNGELQELLGIEQAILSQHLTLLRNKDLLASTRSGKHTFWTLKRPDFLKIVNSLEHCCDTL